jgi:hypothetical protein
MTTECSHPHIVGKPKATKTAIPNDPVAQRCAAVIQGQQAASDYLQNLVNCELSGNELFGSVLTIVQGPYGTTALRWMLRELQARIVSSQLFGRSH